MCFTRQFFCRSAKRAGSRKCGDHVEWAMNGTGLVVNKERREELKCSDSFQEEESRFNSEV